MEDARTAIRVNKIRWWESVKLVFNEQNTYVQDKAHVNEAIYKAFISDVGDTAVLKVAF